MSWKSDIEERLADHKATLKRYKSEERKMVNSSVIHWEKLIRLRSYIRSERTIITELSLIIGRNSSIFDNIKVG